MEQNVRKLGLIDASLYIVCKCVSRLNQIMVVLQTNATKLDIISYWREKVIIVYFIFNTRHTVFSLLVKHNFFILSETKLDLNNYVLLK